MKSKDILLNIAFFTQTGIGVLGNSFLICLFSFAFFSGHKMRFIDTIITQLAMANCLGILLKGIPKILTTLGMRNFLDQVGCKIIFYLQRVTRDLSLSITCLLSCFQAITISPSNSKWAELKARVPKHLLPFSLCCWTFHLLFCSYVLSQIQGSRHMRNITEIQDLGYCPYKLASGFQASLFSIILSFPDAVYVVVMLSTSGYMVLLLYRHHKQIQQVHLTCLSPRISPETRATKAILLLVSTFVSSYSLNCILTVYMSFTKSPSWLFHTSAFLAACFPVVSPYVLIITDSQVPRYLNDLCGRKTLNSDPDRLIFSTWNDSMKQSERRRSQIK